MNQRTTRLRLAGFAGLLVFFLPGAAAACAVCFSGRTEDTRVAFEVSTAGMTLLPLILIGSVAWWVRARARALDAAPTTPRRVTAVRSRL